MNIPSEHHCPNCGKVYKPSLKVGARNTWIHGRIQDEFPNATPLQREQHISGCCTKKCYIEFDNGRFSGMDMGDEP